MCITDESSSCCGPQLVIRSKTTRILLLLGVLGQCASVAAEASSDETDYCPLPQSTGAPVCAEGATPGSSTAPENTERFVGNPIDVVSGNKYQREIDFQSFASDLAFVRHYNSALGDHNLGLGPGWRHSYHVVLSRISDERLRIVQSDGRAIDFLHEPGTDSPAIYKSTNASDGIIHHSDQIQWSLPDGRVFRFHGSYLVAIDFGAGRGESTLFYENRRLKTITDAFGQTLRLNYVSASDALPSYGTQERWSPPGALESVELPNGNKIRYEYDERSRLDTVVYPDNTRSQYQHQDESWPTHLTRRQSSVDNRDTQWAYDEHGRANHWQESGQGNALSIERNVSLTANTENGQARVIYQGGWEKQFVWEQLRDTEGVASAPLMLQCQGCAVPANDSTSAEAPVVPDTSIGSTDVDNNEEPAQSEFRIMVRPEVEQSGGQVNAQNNGENNRQNNEQQDALGSDNPNTTLWRVQVDIDNHSIEALLSVDRLGEIKDLQLGPTSLKSLANQILQGEAAECSDSSANRLNDLANGATPCIDDFLQMLELSNELEDGGIQLRRSGRSNRSSMTEEEKQAAIDAQTENQDPPPEFRILIMPRPRGDPFCKLPPGKTCDELLEDRDMAALSACVYDGGAHLCPRGIYRVTPETVGLNSADFDSDGFHAELFYDPRRDRYTLVFRGTDGDGDDWSANLRQGAGWWARQYELATTLAITVNDNFPGENLNISGHSLGGGLATIASLVTEREATVFNAAALHPNTAERYLVERQYESADNLIDHVHTGSDPLSVLQQFGDAVDIFDMLGTREVPGVNTQIPNPDDEWLDDQRLEHGFLGGNRLLSYHSMAAVLRSLDNLIARHCAGNRWIRY